MSQPKRLGALNKFKSKQRSILIATDVASRGLDIPAVRPSSFSLPFLSAIFDSSSFFEEFFCITFLTSFSRKSHRFFSSCHRTSTKVDVVINFDIPTNGKEYIHRVGRTARAGRAGRSLAFVTQYDVEVYQRLEVLLGTKLPEFPADEETVRRQNFEMFFCVILWHAEKLFP